MSKTIFKYQIPLQGATVLNVPENPWFLRAMLQGGAIMVWAVVDPDAPTQPRTFKVYGTGTEDPTGNEYLGSVIMGAFVWHVFVAPADV